MSEANLTQWEGLLILRHCGESWRAGIGVIRDMNHCNLGE